MDEAAIAKAKYKEKREIKFSIDNIIKEYEKLPIYIKSKMNNAKIKKKKNQIRIIELMNS